MITWLKLGGILAAIVGIFAFGYHLGGLHGVAALERAQAAQTAAALKATQAALDAEHANAIKQQGVISTYEAQLLQPLDASGIARRVLVAASGNACPMPEDPADSAGAHATTAIAAGPPAIAAALADYIDACSKDADQLTALQALAPQ